MELIAAMETIRALHEGKSPGTEEALPQDSICVQSEVQEALALALEHLAAAVDERLRKQSLPPNQGKPWSHAEDDQLSREFDQSLSEREIAEIHGRSQWAITKRLERLGKLVAATGSSSQSSVQAA